MTTRQKRQRELEKKFRDERKSKKPSLALYPKMMPPARVANPKERRREVIKRLLQNDEAAIHGPSPGFKCPQGPNPTVGSQGGSGGTQGLNQKFTVGLLRKYVREPNRQPQVQQLWLTSS